MYLHTYKQPGLMEQQGDPATKNTKIQTEDKIAGPPKKPEAG